MLQQLIFLAIQPDIKQKQIFFSFFNFETLKVKLLSNKSVCISTRSGLIFNYELHSLNHLWTLKVSDSVMKHCMNEENIFAVTSDRSKNVGHIFVIDRLLGIHLRTVLDAHSFRYKNKIKYIYKQVYLISTKVYVFIKMGFKD